MRKRIVIDLDAREGTHAGQSRTAGAKRRRWPRVLAILFGLFVVGVVVVLIASFLWWRNYQSTPAYTLTLMVDAAQRLFDADRFLWQANKSQTGNPFGDHAMRLPNKPHGLNSFTDVNNIAFLSARRRWPTFSGHVFCATTRRTQSGKIEIAFCFPPDTVRC